MEFLDLRIYEELLNVFLYEYRGTGNFFDVEFLSVIRRVVGFRVIFESDEDFLRK